MPMLEKRRKIAKADVTVFINGGADYGSAMPAVPCWIVGSTPKKGDPKWRPAHDHRARIAGAGCDRVLQLWSNGTHWTTPAWEALPSSSFRHSRLVVMCS